MLSPPAINISIIAFDDFTDIDVFMVWDLLKRIKDPRWQVRILGGASHLTSVNGLTIPVHGSLAEANSSAAVIFASGPGTRKVIEDDAFLRTFQLNPERQLIASMCSGALILGALGLLDGKEATTYPTVVKKLKTYGAKVVEKPFVPVGNIATAAGCLSAQHLSGWIIERFYGPEIREIVLKSVQPVGQGLTFQDVDLERKIGLARAISTFYATPL